MSLKSHLYTQDFFIYILMDDGLIDFLQTYHGICTCVQSILIFQHEQQVTFHVCVTQI